MKIHKPLEILDVQKKYPKWYKFWTGVPGGVALLIILSVVVGYTLFLAYEITGAMFFVGTLILIYFLWWLIRGCEYIVATISALFQLRRTEKYDFNKIFSVREDMKNTSSSAVDAYSELKNDELLLLKKLPNDKAPADVIHWCMIPMYNEGADILRETVQAIRDSNYDMSRIAVSIHGEAAKTENFQAALEACKEIGKDFGYFGHTLHELQPDEMQGKGANITYGIQQLYPKILEHFDTTADNILVTTLDADNIPDKEYFVTLTHTFLTTPNRQYVSYQPIVFFFNNFWQAPFFSKIVSLFNTFWILFNFTKRYGPRNFSSHAQPLQALIEVDFWSKQTIVEDGHQYRRSFFGFKGNYECVPVYAKIYQDCNLDETIGKTMKAQYNQMRRWSHGAQDIPYVRCQMIDQRKTLNKSRVLYEFGRALEGIILWGTLHVVLLAGLVFSFLKDVPLSSYLSLGTTISIFTKVALALTFSSLLLSISVFPFKKLKGKTNRDLTKIMIEFIIGFFILVGPSLITFSGLPALHTQIGILFGRPMKKFNVTKKVR